MQIGVLFTFQNFLDRLSDKEAYERDLALAELVEPMGYDWISAVEHHFTSYAMSPGNLQFLSWIAARTSRIGLMPGAVILPWNDPLRVVEQMIMLDHLSKGRAILGIGRGLAIREYKSFGVDMNEARDRFNEAAEVIVRGVETGVVEGDGPFYPYKPTRIRPGPYASMRDRFNCVAMSPDTVPICARLGGRLMSFAIKPWEQLAPQFDEYRTLFEQHHGRKALPPMCVDSCFCDESADRAEEMARECITNYYITVMDHYEMAGEHFRDLKGYSGYAESADALRAAGMDAGAEGYFHANLWGSPQQILDKLDKRRDIVGNFDLMLSLSFGGLSQAEVTNSMRLIAEKVLPEVRSWTDAGTVHA